jgi:UDP-3-O-[3-hydroxymyristoyl] glucosamine N-acyltransferase
MPNSYLIAGTGYPDIIRTVIPLEAQGHKLRGYIDDNSENASRVYPPYRLMGSFEYILESDFAPLRVFNSIARNADVRKSSTERLVSLGYELVSLIHPTCFVPSSSIIGINTLIEENVYIGASVRISDSCFCQSGATISHGAIIKTGCIISHGVTLGGDVVLEESVFLGPGVVIAPGLRIAKGVKVSAGTYIYKDILKEHATVLPYPVHVI